MFISIMKEKTTVALEKETVNKLKGLKIAKRESYDEIINRLIKFLKDNSNVK